MTLIPSVISHRSHQESQIGLFKRLPLELRCLVFEKIDPPPRSIIVRQSSHGYFICSPPPPVALQICSVSRQRALRRFKPLFNGKDGKSRPIYVRPQIDSIFLDLLDLHSFITRCPEVHEFYTIIVPEVAMGYFWDALPSVKRLLVTDSLSDKRHQRYYDPISVVPDSSRKEDEKKWARCITDYLDSVPEVYAVRICSDNNWTYLLASRQLVRLQAKRLDGSWVWDDEPRDNEDRAESFSFSWVQDVEFAVSAFSSFGKEAFKGYIKDTLTKAAYHYLEYLDEKIEAGIE